MLLTNLDYLKISIKNEEKTFDSSYMFLNKNLNIDNYVKVTQELKELLATIKTLKVRNQNTEQIYKDLFNIWKSEFAGQSEFNCFLSACDITRDKLFYNFEDFKTVVDLYLENRDLELYTPVHWIQALLDSISSKAKGKCGENKIIKIAIEEGFKLVNSWEEFNKNKKAISSFSKNIFDIINIEKNLGVKLPNEKQNKLLDIILKNDKQYIFIEAKHLKEQGGEQNKQMEELISLISHKMSTNFMLGAFLDGSYSNKLLSSISEDNIKDYNTISEKNKIDKQRKDILFALKENNNSFWFNTKGFKSFIKDF